MPVIRKILLVCAEVESWGVGDSANESVFHFFLMSTALCDAFVHT
jgi:hypothetical protein